jgi:hypothetical protein
VCAAFQRSGIELVRFGRDDDEHPNLLPLLGEISNFVDKRLRQKKSVLFWETGGGTACLVAYGEDSDAQCRVLLIEDIFNSNERPPYRILCSSQYCPRRKAWSDC